MSREVTTVSQSPECAFVRMHDLVTRNLNPDKLNVVLRHDVDAFPERMHLFYEIERRWQDRWEAEHTFSTPNPTGRHASRRRRTVRITLICIGILVLTALAASLGLNGR